MKSLKTKEIAALLSLTAQRCRQLADEGVLRRLAANLFDGPASVAGYLAYRERKLVDDLGGPGSLNDERRKLVAARAEIAEMERAKMAGELVPGAQIETVWLGIVRVVRSRLLAIPAKTAARIGMATNAVEAQQIIRTEIIEALAELSTVAFDVESERPVINGQP